MNRKKGSSVRLVKRLIAEAQSYLNKGQLEQSNCLYQQVLHHDPKNTVALNGLGMVAMKAGMIKLAIEFLGRACEHEPENYSYNINLARAYSQEKQTKDAMLQYIYVLDINENSSEAHCELARLNLISGNPGLALQHYRYAFDLDPDDPESLHGIVHLDEKVISSGDIDHIENLLRTKDLPLEKRCSYYFALGNIYDKRGRYDEAFANYSVANLCKRARFDLREHTRMVTQIIENFSTTLFDFFDKSELNASDQPVFVVGMPHSGTEIVDVLLANHHNISSAGNIDYLKGFSGYLDMFDSEDIGTINKDRYILIERLNHAARYYLNEINNLVVEAVNTPQLRIINSLSSNYLHLGLISLLFPQAKIIHCRRDPQEICILNYFSDFTNGHEYSYDQADLVQFYCQYERLMTHWKEVLPIDILSIEYTELVAQDDTVNKQIFDYIGMSDYPAIPQANENLCIESNNDDSYWGCYKSYLDIIGTSLASSTQIKSVLSVDSPGK